MRAMTMKGWTVQSILVDLLFHKSFVCYHLCSFKQLIHPHSPMHVLMSSWHQHQCQAAPESTVCASKRLCTTCCIMQRQASDLHSPCAHTAERMLIR
jgi:hypothetical protein